MDINSLLSPQDSPASENPPSTGPSPLSSPKRTARPGRLNQRRSSGLSNQIAHAPSPRSYDGHGPAVHSPLYQQHSPLHSSVGSAYGAGALPSPGSVTTAPRTSTPGQHAPSLHRQGSTPGMDTLADLASMQQHHQQNARQNVSYNVHNLPRPTLSARSSNEHAMADLPASPKMISSRMLTDEENATLKTIATTLGTASYNYEAHKTRVHLLRKAFKMELEATGEANAELLLELRSARQDMDTRFPVGEELLIDWINDEAALATSVEDSINLVDFCKRAIADEPTSAKVWRIFGDYMYSLWAACNDHDGDSSWTEEDKLVGQEFFTFDEMLQTWEQGVAAVQWHLNESNIVWDRYIEVLIEHHESSMTPEAYQKLESLFIDRLMKPHATWDETQSNFSTFVSTYNQQNWESTLANVNKQAAKAKKQYALRESFEFDIAKAVSAGDKLAEYEAYSAYIHWEIKSKGVFSSHHINAIFERATVRFPSLPTFWEQYVAFLIQHSMSEVSLLSVLERANRHCPWSGDLWSQRILTLEAERSPFDKVEEIKHKATRTGLLDVGTMEQLLKVHTAWCGFLRRRAFESSAAEDDLDIAEVGIRSALEHVRETGEKTQGAEWIDPSFRLERIHIKFHFQRGNIEAARDIWKSLIPRYSRSYDFWYRYYIWEMVCWGKNEMRPGMDASLPPPREATRVLLQALDHIETMDQPEQLTGMFSSHCEQHESVNELRLAIVKVNQANELIAYRRQKEMAAAAAQTVPVVYSDQAAADVEMADVATTATNKRRRESESLGPNTKKIGAVGETNGAPSYVAKPERDREHCTIMVSNLPADVTDFQVRKFFTDCGKINSIKRKPNSGGSSQDGMIEFESPDEAHYAAEKKSGTMFGENSIGVSVATETTLYVKNYPPTADEKYIRNLFKDCGDIVDVRFPSLKANAHRRFCYVNFLTSEQAHKATQLHDTILPGGLKLGALISDPSKAVPRNVPQAEGREIFMGNMAWKLTEKEIEEFLSPYGAVESVFIKRKADGSSKGIAMVSFEHKHEAERAVEATNNKPFNGRIIRVSISRPVYNLSGATEVLSLASSEADPASPGQNGPGAASAGAKAKAKAFDCFECTLALLELPDTVNTARLEAIAAPYGKVVQIRLRPDHGGALLEFEDQHSCAKAALGLEGFEIDPGHKIRTGNKTDLFKGTAEWHADRLGVKPKGEEDMIRNKVKTNLRPPQVTKRVASGGARRGGKGGLGTQSKGLRYTGGEEEKTKGGEGDAMGGIEDVKPAKKSNADFKALFNKPKE